MMSVAGTGGSMSRVIALVDMDCFYVQVEERDNPAIKGVPAAVVQYKAFKGGGIIAVNYEARAKGVGRNMRGDDAKAACPEIILVRVPEANGKANLGKYRDAGKEVLDVICQFSACVERASIDEAYIDLTDAVNEHLYKVSPNPEDDLPLCLDSIDKSLLDTSFPVGFDSTLQWLDSLKDSDFVSIEDVKLAVGSEIVGRMRKAVLEQTGFKCSAGIAHNKVLAKLGAGMNKPNKQTVITHSAVPTLYAQTKIRKVRMLGGQFGDSLVDIFNCELMSELLQFSLKQFTNTFGDERGHWLYNLARGFDDEPVVIRQLPKSVGCSKNFLGPETLTTKEKVNDWVGRLCLEVAERLEKDYEMNNRRAKNLTLHVKFKGKKSISRSCGKFVPYHPDKIAALVNGVVDKIYKEYNGLPINSLGLVATKLEEDITKNTTKISSFYAPTSHEPSTSTAVLSDVNVDIVKEYQVRSGPHSPDIFEESLVYENGEEDQANKHHEAQSANCDKLKTGVTIKDGNKLLQATRVRLLSCTQSDEEIDVEGSTPESPHPAMPNPVSPPSEPTVEIIPAEVSSELANEINDKHPTGKTKAMSESPTKKGGFVCGKSPIKGRKIAIHLSKNKPIPSVFPCLTKLVNAEDTNMTPKSHTSSPVKPVIVVKACSESKSPIKSSADDVTGMGTDTRALAKEYLQACEICKQEIPLWEILDHKDYHVALDLQKEFNGGFPSSLPGPGGSTSTTAGTASHKRAASAGTNSRGKSKRGRSTKPAPPPSKTLRSYFLPK